METNKMHWKNVDEMDEHNINIVQLFNKEKNEMLIVSGDYEAHIEFIHLKIKPTFEKGELVYIEDAEDIERNAYTEEHEYKAFLDLIKHLISK